MMTHIDEGMDRRRRSDKVVPPFSLLISFLRDAKGASADQARHIRDFIELLNSEGYEEVRDAVIDEWARIKYTTAYSAAHPPTIDELRRRREELRRQRQEAAEQARKAIDAAKLKITRRALSLVMPNNKTLANCTGAECMQFGGWFSKVGERVGAKRLVGDVLTNKDLLKIAEES